MVPDGRTDGMDGQTDGRTDDAKTISLRLRRGIKTIFRTEIHNFIEILTGNPLKYKKDNAIIIVSKKISRSPKPLED